MKLFYFSKKISKNFYLCLKTYFYFFQRNINSPKVEIEHFSMNNNDNQLKPLMRIIFETIQISYNKQTRGGGRKNDSKLFIGA